MYVCMYVDSSLLTLPPLAPTKPTNLISFPYPDSICIEWETPDDNGGSDIIGYHVEIDDDVRSNNLSSTTGRFLFEKLMNDIMYQ